MNIGVPKETDPVESRSAIIPGNVKRLVALGATVQIETGAGDGSGFSEEAFTAEGATFLRDRQSLLGAADIVLRVRKPPPGTPPPNRVALPKPAKLNVDVVQLLLEERQGHR